MAITDKAQSCQPLVDDGERLATIDRGPNVELRIGLKEFKGHRFIRLQEWAANAHNSQWWPTKGKGCSVKLRELDAVITALTQARAKLAAEGPTAEATRQDITPRSRSSARPYNPATTV